MKARITNCWSTALFLAPEVRLRFGTALYVAHSIGDHLFLAPEVRLRFGEPWATN